MVTVGIASEAWRNASLPVRREILIQGGGHPGSIELMVNRPWSALSLWAKKVVRRWKRDHL